MSKLVDLKRSVEARSGQCRTLAIALEDYVEHTRLLGDPERQILRGYAIQFKGVADGLTEALAQADRHRLKGLWTTGGAALVALLLIQPAIEGAVSGISETATNHLLSDAPTVTTCAEETLRGFRSTDLVALGINDLHPVLLSASSTATATLTVSGQTTHAPAQPAVATATGHDPQPAMTRTIEGTGTMDYRGSVEAVLTRHDRSEERTHDQQDRPTETEIGTAADQTRSIPPTEHD